MAREYVKTDTMRIKISANPFAAEEEMTGLDMIAQDSQPEAKEEPQAFERDFNELLDSVYDAVIITDTKGLITKFNARALEYFLYESDDFSKLNVLNVISGADEHTLKTVYETLSSERRIFIEGYCMPREGDPFPAEITVSLLHVKGVEQLFFFIRNVIVRVKTEEALRKAQQELLETAHHAGMAEIATGVLHDVGNLLNSINVSCELILSCLEDSSLTSFLRVNNQVRKIEDLPGYIANDPKGQKLMEIYQGVGECLAGEHEQIEKESENLKAKIQIVKEVISTQQTYAKAGLFEEQVQLEVLVEDALAILKSTLEAENLTIEKTFDPVPNVKVQKSKFVHILLNLLKNARDALMNVTDRPRQMDIRIKADNAFATVSVTDNGEGIAPEAMDKIFTHGFTTKQSGHGFGLHSCANLMTEMGGKIQVRSDGLGQGATFSLTLPLAKKS